MQYSVPQFVEVEDKIIGPLTLKQFIILIFGGLLAFMLWTIFGPGLVFFILLVPLLIIFAAIALGRFNGQPVLKSLPYLIQFFMRPRYRVFRRIGEKSALIKKTEELKVQPAQNETALESKGSRLKKLAYVLDQQADAEQQLAIRSTNGYESTK